MATHSSILAWRIPWTEGPVELQSMGLQSRTQLKQFSRHAPIQECRLYNLLCVGGGVCKTLLELLNYLWQLTFPGCFITILSKF